MYKYFYDQVNNVNIIQDSASTYSFVAPTPSAPGYVLVSGTTADENKTFQLEVTVTLLPEGCDSVVNRYVTIASAPVANFFAPNDTLCQNINNLFSNVSTTNVFTQPLQFSWDFGDGTSSTAASPIKNYSTPGTYRVRMIVRNNTTLLDSLATTIVVLPSPVADFTSTLSCAGKVSKFTSTGPHSAGNFYRFNIGGQVADSSVVDVIVQGSDTIINANLFVRNTVGCTDTITKAIQVFAQPVASFTAQDVCAGSSVQFTNNSSIDAGKNGRVNTFGSEWAFGNGDVGYSNNPLYFYPQGGSYRAVLKVISNYGCIDTVSKVVNIFNKPVVNFTLDNTCKGSNLIINNNTTFAGGLARVKYRWNFGDNTLPRTEAVPNKAFGAIGSYFVTLVATDSVNGCLDSMRIVAQVKDKAMADFTAENGCVGKDVNFTNQSIVPAGTSPVFTYLFGDNGTSNQPNTTHAYAIGGSKTIRFIVDIDGCKDTATKSIIISLPISVDYTIDSLSPNSYRFTANRTGLARYTWNFGDGTPLVNTSSNVYTHIFDRKGWNVVTLTVQDSNACDAVSVDSVFIDRRVGLNDVIAENVNFNVYPNPFATTTNVAFDLDKSEKVVLDVYDMMGRKVYTYQAGTLTAGPQSIEIDETKFDAKSAVYMIRLSIGTDVISRQLIKQ
jgi:PKD repeat protein